MIRLITRRARIAAQLIALTSGLILAGLGCAAVILLAAYGGLLR